MKNKTLSFPGGFPDPPRGGARADGHAHHPLPRAHQHLQHRHHQLAQRGGNDRHRSMDAGLHFLRLLCLNRVGEAP